MPTRSNKHDNPETVGRTRWDIIAALLLVLFTLVVFQQVRHFDFINFDDPLYITDNPNVQSGIHAHSVRWALTTPVASNYHPVTMLSHMLDCQLYGMNAGQHHMTGVLIHIVNTLLLFFVLKGMTGDLWPSVVVAFLFGLHPLHVESVAWVSERKDVLSTFFWFLTLLSYTRYTRKPQFTRYLPVVVFFVLGLLSKPMLVTLPFALLLLDYWPLRRLGEPLKHANRRVLVEKAPLFFISALFCIVTFIVQKSGGSVVGPNVYPLDVRISNALISYVLYIFKMFWPTRLAVIYPHPGVAMIWQAAAACLLLLTITAAAVKTRKDAPYFITGWLWFLGTLVPVIGIVQVGSQAMADRYTYIPLVGLFAAFAWGFFNPSVMKGHLKKYMTGALILLLGVMTLKTMQQVALWQNSITLFAHTTRVTANNAVAHKNLGLALAEKGRLGDARPQFEKVLEIQPDNAEAHHNLGTCFMLDGDLEKAATHYEEAIELNPDYEKTYNNLGLVLLKKGEIEAAKTNFKKALELKPGYEEAKNNLEKAAALHNP